MLDIVFLALLALFLALKLRSILGRESELDLLAEKDRAKKRLVDVTPSKTQKTPEAERKPSGRYTPKGANLLDESARDGFLGIQKILPDLTPERFISLGAEVLFLMIESYDQNRIEDIRQLVSSDIYSNLSAALDAERSAGIKERMSIVKILDAQIVSAEEEKGFFRVKIVFNTRQSHSTESLSPQKDSSNSEVIIEARDVWEFSRPKGDNSASWIVSSIASS